MSKLTTGLGLVLALQVVITLGLYFNAQKNQQHEQSQALLNLEIEQIDKIVIQEKGSLATLFKQGQNWILSERGQLPVDLNQLKALLGKLESLQAGWPVSTSTSSHERFEVNENAYQRHLQLYQGNQIKAELYIGTSPGFRKVHVRKAGQDLVYAVKLNAFDLPSSSDEWLDRSLLAVDNIRAIQGSNYRLEKQGDDWMLAQGQKEGDDLNEKSLQKLLSAFESLRIRGLVELTEDQQVQNGTRLTVTQVNKVLRYHFFQIDQQYLIHRDDYPYTFSLAELDYQSIVGIFPKELLKMSLREGRVNNGMETIAPEEESAK